jgi:hypothetical protein
MTQLAFAIHELPGDCATAPVDAAGSFLRYASYSTRANGHSLLLNACLRSGEQEPANVRERTAGQTGRPQ